MNALISSLLDLLATADVRVLALVFLVPFIGTLLLVPWLMIQLPPDYFHPDTRRPLLWGGQHPVLRFLLISGKNLLGLIVMLLGIAMLVLPGPGLITMLVGFFMLDFPGKYHWERWLISRKPVLHTVNKLRQKSGHPPFEI